MHKEVEIQVWYDFDDNSDEFDYAALTDSLPTNEAVYLTVYGPTAQSAVEKLHAGLIDLGFVAEGEIVKVLDDTGEIEENE